MKPRDGRPAGKAGERALWASLHVLVLSFAVWLVSPLIVITADDYRAKEAIGLRLAGGLLIFILYAGKWTFDVFAPQGLARRVSPLKTAALVVFILAVSTFMIFVVAQAASLFLQTAVEEAESGAAGLETRLEAVPAPRPLISGKKSV